MDTRKPFLRPTEAARQLGVSTKTLRVYEKRGLISPGRTAAGWRVYGPDEMTRAKRIVVLRALGLSLGQVAGVLEADPHGVDAILAEHQAALARQSDRLAELSDRVGRLRTEIARPESMPGKPASDAAAKHASVAFELPWPWGGEAFELSNIRALNFITGPLGSGKTRLARRIAETLPDTIFLGLERLEGVGNEPPNQRVDAALNELVAADVSVPVPLVVLLKALHSDDNKNLVVDMVEQGLDEATQVALGTYLRTRWAADRCLFLMTRSTAILDLATMGPDESIIFCPPNHSPPKTVRPRQGSAGYENVASCLASPRVRARTEGVVAVRQPVG